MKMRVNYAVDVVLLLTFLVCGFTGILKFPELNLAFNDADYELLTLVHDWSGVGGLVLALVHFVLHAKWFRNATLHLFWPQALKKKGSALAKASLRTRGTLVLLVFLTLVPIGLYARGGHPSYATIPQGIHYPSGTLEDGSWTGTAVGYEPGLTVQVVVRNGKIESVRVVSHNETPRWYNRVVSYPQRIVAAQSTDIDVVTGCTCTCQGMLSAVEAALKQASKASL